MKRDTFTKAATQAGTLECEVIQGLVFSSPADLLTESLSTYFSPFSLSPCSLSRYSIVEEAYLPPSADVKESKETPGKFSCSETGNIVEWNEEENYLFRLTDFKEPLRKWLTENEVRMQNFFCGK